MNTLPTLAEPERNDITSGSGLVDRKQQLELMQPPPSGPVQISRERLTRYVIDSRWCAQQAITGGSVLVRKEGSEVQIMNTGGERVHLSELLVQEIQSLSGDFMLEGHCIAQQLQVFDLLQRSQFDLRSQPYRKRLLTLTQMFAYRHRRALVLMPTAFTTGQKQSLLKKLESARAESIVFRRLSAPHTRDTWAGAPAQVVCRLAARLCAVVAGHAANRSVELRLLSFQGWVPITTLTIPAAQAVPDIGEVVEIQYLHALRGSHSVCEGAFVQVRTDLEPHECLMSQLRYEPVAQHTSGSPSDSPA